MKGYQVTFFTEQDKKHGHQPMAEWLMEFARAHGASGATASAGYESFGANGRMHSAHFFELADQPVVVTIAASEDACDRLFAAIRQEGVVLFYVKSEVEFGSTEDADN